MKFKYILPVLLIVAIVLFDACDAEKPKKEKIRFKAEKEVVKENNPNLYKISKTQFENQDMKLGSISMYNVQQAISAAGYIEVPKESISEVRSYIGGYLQSSPLLPGDYVKKGQFLIRLENLEYIQLQQDFLQAKQELTYLKAVFERQKVLADEQITSQSNKQFAESEYYSALANFEGLKKKLQLININPDKIQAENISSFIRLYAPISGYITTMNAVNGKYAEPTDVIFEIINTDHLHIELKVYEKDILNVKKGQKISFRIPEADNKSYSGEVFMVGKTIEETHRTVLVHCHIDNGSSIPAVVGMYIEAEVFMGGSENICVPKIAFHQIDDDYFVYVNTLSSDDEYKFEKVKVDVNKEYENCIEITGETAIELEGEQILIDGASNL